MPLTNIYVQLENAPAPLFAHAYDLRMRLAYQNNRRPPFLNCHRNLVIRLIFVQN